MPKSEKSVDNFWFDLFQTSCEFHSSRQEDDMKPLSDYLKPKCECQHARYTAGMAGIF